MGDVADELDLNDPPFPLTAIDREILATRDEDYHRVTWEDLKLIIGMSAWCVRQVYINTKYHQSKQRTRAAETPALGLAQVPTLVVQDQESIWQHHQFCRQRAPYLDPQRP